MKLSFVRKPTAISAPIAIARLRVSPRLNARARQKKIAADRVEHRFWGHGSGCEPQQRGERCPQATDRPRPWGPGKALAHEHEREQRRQPRHQRAQQTHQLEAVQQRAARSQVVGDRLERVIQGRLCGRHPCTPRADSVEWQRQVFLKLSLCRSRRSCGLPGATPLLPGAGL